ncbi:hypothetical protein Fcan01_15853 [Folsomia candida]|uniref:Uncharacterized protein n=1 Tax=Folsomia candida TaxID=158441 RepID=A0A226DWV5_FOLCA|nr:hypothetical protein Fcan01_15853 [Folsomia candida]
MSSFPYISIFYLFFTLRVFVTYSNYSTVNLTESLFRHLDPDCHLILAHHNNLQNSDILSTLVPPKNGLYLYHLPQINTSTWTKFRGAAIRVDQNTRGIYAISQKAQFSRAYCFIGVIITQKSDFTRKLKKLSDIEFSSITKHQTNILHHIMYSNYPIIEFTKQKSNLHISLLIRVQLNFSRIMHEGYIRTAVFKFCLNLILMQGHEEWYRVSLVSLLNYKIALVSRQYVLNIINNQFHFHLLLEPPTDLYLISMRTPLHLNGYYGLKACCREYDKGPFHLIRVERYHPRVTLFFSLVCIGNFTYGEADDDNESLFKYRQRRGHEKSTYIEQIYMDNFREMTPRPPIVYFGTVHQGFSFMTCFSREELSFQVFLKPFEVEVWVTLLLSMVTIGGVFVFILLHKFQWDLFEAISFAQLVVVSTVLDKPTDVARKIKRISEYKILLGFWILLVPILSNAYLGLSITSISSPLESKSVTSFKELAKPGCIRGNVECHISRIKVFHKYTQVLNRYLFAAWGRLVYTSPNINPFLVFNISQATEALRNTSMRRFDVNQDFVLLPYSLEVNISSRKYATRNNFYDGLETRLYIIRDIVLEKFKFRNITIPSDYIDILQLRDLIDPWHIPHPFLGNFTDTMYIKNEWDIEHALVQCGRTALVLDEREIVNELRYFEKHYPWIKFFKSVESILTSESGDHPASGGLAPYGDPAKVKYYKEDYTTEIFGLKPNTVEWLTFEKKLHNIPGDARKKMNRLTGLAGNSTIMSPEFSCSNSDDSETRVEEYLNLVGEN